MKTTEVVNLPVGAGSWSKWLMLEDNNCEDPWILKFIVQQQAEKIKAHNFMVEK